MNAFVETHGTWAEAVIRGSRLGLVFTVGVESVSLGVSLFRPWIAEEPWRLKLGLVFVMLTLEVWPCE